MTSFAIEVPHYEVNILIAPDFISGPVSDNLVFED